MDSTQNSIPLETHALTKQLTLNLFLTPLLLTAHFFEEPEKVAMRCA
jgi:hypothetical protein